METKTTKKTFKSRRISKDEALELIPKQYQIEIWEVGIKIKQPVYFPILCDEIFLRENESNDEEIHIRFLNKNKYFEGDKWINITFKKNTTYLFISA